jgi:hypothetical protein
MRKPVIAVVLSVMALSLGTTSLAWNLGARYVNALRFEKDGTILFTLFDTGTSGPEYICDVTLPPADRGGQWFQISSCSIGNGKGNNSASSTCLASVDRMAEMLLKAKVEGIPVHVTRETSPDRCGVTEVALKPLP